MIIKRVYSKNFQIIKWKKSMKWGEFDLNWGRPLKSIYQYLIKR